MPETRHDYSLVSGLSKKLTGRERSSDRVTERSSDRVNSVQHNTRKRLRHFPSNKKEKISTGGLETPAFVTFRLQVQKRYHETNLADVRILRKNVIYQQMSEIHYKSKSNKFSVQSFVSVNIVHSILKEKRGQLYKNYY